MRKITEFAAADDIKAGDAVHLGDDGLLRKATGICPTGALTEASFAEAMKGLAKAGGFLVPKEVRILIRPEDFDKFNPR
jgi:hypothetical protein